MTHTEPPIPLCDRWLRALVPAIAMLVWIGSGSLRTRAAEETVYVDDFEAGILLDWECAGVSVEITETMGNATLHIAGVGEAVFALEDFERCVVELDIRGEGGVRLGGGYSVHLTSASGGSLRVSDRSGKSLASVKTGHKTGLPQRLKVVCVDTLLRVYVGDRLLFQTMDAAPRSGPVVLAAVGRGAMFDNVTIATAFAHGDGAVAVPVADDDALVFSSADETLLSLVVANYSDKDLKLVTSVHAFRGVPVAGNAIDKEAADATVVEFGVDKFFRIETIPDGVRAVRDTVAKANSRDTRQIGLGSLPEGLHMLELSFFDGAERVNVRRYPLAVLSPMPVREAVKPAIPLGVYTKLMQFLRKTEPLWRRTYVHAIAHDLAGHGLNTVVAAGSFVPETIEIFNHYGVVVLERDGQCLEHPGVIGALLGDEPKPEDMEELKDRYATLRARSDKLLLTCMVGDSIGVGRGGGALALWKRLQPRTRMFRWYGIKKHFYGILHHVAYKGILPLTSILSIVRSADKTPFWVVLPTFGGTRHEAYFQYPSPAQARGMIHLVIAHGARGLLLFTYQGDGGFTAMTDPVTLQHNGDVLAAVGGAATAIGANADLIAELVPSGGDVRCHNPYIEVVGRRDGAGKRYVYAVNKNTKAAVSTHLLWWAERLDVTGARNLFSGESLEIGKDDEGYWSVPLRLEAGAGALLAVDVQGRK